MKQLILASASERRKELLAIVGLKFKVVPSKAEEKLNPRLKPRAQAEELSRKKAKAVAKKFADALIIGADSIVVIDDEIIGKPKDNADAKRILRKLQGRMHQVITGFTIIDTTTGKSVTKSVVTDVYMRKVTDKEIEAYVESQYLLDKAGAYAIQGMATIFFEKINGNFYNVVGLPVYHVVQELKKFGVMVL